MIKIESIETALRIYYENLELGNDESIELFGLSKKSTATMIRLKKQARKKMIEEGVKSFAANSIDTKTAYEVWGIDVAVLEKNRKKLISLGLHEPT